MNARPICLVVPFLLAGIVLAASMPAVRAADAAEAKMDTRVFDRNRERLLDIRARLRALREDSQDSSESQISQAQAQLERLIERLDVATRSLSAMPIAAIQQARQEVDRRVTRLHVRTRILEAKVRVARALDAAARKEFGPVENELKAAAELVRTARLDLGSDREFADQLAVFAAALPKALTAARAGSAEAAREIGQAINSANLLIDKLQLDEISAAASSIL